MAYSALRHPSWPRSSTRDDWHTEQRILELQAEVERTQAELEVLRATTAQVVAAMLAEMHSRTAPVAAPADIQKLADLSEPVDAASSTDLIGADIEEIDVRNRQSLAYLDRRYRWLPPRRPTS